MHHWPGRSHFLEWSTTATGHCYPRRSASACAASLLAKWQHPGNDARYYASPSFCWSAECARPTLRSEEHTSELQSHSDLVCRLLLEKKKKKTRKQTENK